MIKQCLLWGFLIMTVVDSGAQTLTAASDPFTFPPITAIKAPQNRGHHSAYFTASHPSSRMAGLQFAWSFPAQPQFQNGSIVVYSPLGRVIKTVPISMSTGTLSWGSDRAPGMGVYIAKITCGSSHQSLKFLICK
jgi:hypothetical protein